MLPIVHDANRGHSVRDVRAPNVRVSANDGAMAGQGYMETGKPPWE